MAQKQPSMPDQRPPASLIKRPLVLATASLAVTAAALIGYFTLQPGASVTSLPATNPTYHKDDSASNLNPRARVAGASRKSQTLPEDALDPMLVQSMLEGIRLDENRAVIMNDETRRLLDQAVFMLGFDENRASLDLLEQLIQGGAPDQVGIEAAAIFRRYYEYKSAEVALLNGASGTAVELNQQLTALRQSYLGHDLSEQLFGEEQKYMRYALEVMSLQETPTLSSSERAEQQLRLQREFYGDEPLEDLAD